MPAHRPSLVPSLPSRVIYDVILCAIDATSRLLFVESILYLQMDVI
jgi:hypothetical protein